MPITTDRRPVITLPRLRVLNLGHHLESLAVAFTVCVLQSVVMFGLRIDSWMHETANFLAHFATASAAARLPVEFVAGTYFALTLMIVVIARRFREARDD